MSVVDDDDLPPSLPVPPPSKTYRSPIVFPDGLLVECNGTDTHQAGGKPWFVVELRFENRTGHDVPWDVEVALDATGTAVLPAVGVTSIARSLAVGEARTVRYRAPGTGIEGGLAVRHNMESRSLEV